MRILSCKKVLTGLMVIMMIVGMNPVPAKAGSVTTSVHHSSGGYTFYVRESGNTNLLGTMSLNKSSTEVTNTFTAARNCGSTTSYVSEISGGYKKNSAGSVSKNTSVIARKGVRNASMIYGYCTVNY